MTLQKIIPRIVFIAFFISSCLQSKGQDKQQFMEYIRVVEKRLDSIKEITIKNEAGYKQKLIELNEKNLALLKALKELDEQKLEVEKLNALMEEKTTYIDSQGNLMGTSMAIAGVAIVSVIALVVTIRDKKLINRNLEEKNELIKKQNLNLKQKNKEITDSINYAKRIQDAILPSSSDVKAALPNSFVYFRPKDIVSGDFYWLSEKDGKTYVVTADCTGHGVPGAFMSMLGISFLNEIVNEKKTFHTANIINELKKSIIGSLYNSEGDKAIKDGMDMALYSLDKRNLKLTYSAANNGIYVIRENKIIKLDPDKQPVSASPRDHLDFNQYEFDLKSNDFIITYSDGFADQFGGPKGKKFKYKQLQDLLLQIHHKPIHTIPSLLNAVFEKWKGPHEQVDDVLIVGVKV